jgi:hypothetical protein
VQPLCPPVVRVVQVVPVVREVKVFVPVPVPATPVGKVIVLPAATPTPMAVPMPPGDPMF